MATKKRKTTRKRKPSAAVQRKERAILTSIALFALGALFTIMLFVTGESVWAAVRGFLFGVFGASMYLLGIALIYIAVLVAQEENLGGVLFKMVLFSFILNGTAILFSSFAFGDATGWDVVLAFYENGKTSVFAGGVLGMPVGGTLLKLCGKPAANILLVLLLLCMSMFFTGVTPAEVVQFFAERFGNAKQRGVIAHEQHLAHRTQQAQVRREKEQVRLEKERVRAQQRAERAEEKEQQRAQAQMDDEFEEEDDWEEDGLQSPRTEQLKEQLFDFFSKSKAKEQSQLKQPQGEEGVHTEVVQKRSEFDVDLGPDAPTITQGDAYLEPFPAGSENSFGMHANEITPPPADDFSMPIPPPVAPLPKPEDAQEQLEQQVHQTQTGANNAAAVAAEMRAAQQYGEDVAGGTPVVKQAPSEAARAAGWISVGAQAQPDIVVSDSAEIANLAAAAMNKPKMAAENASAAPMPTAEPLVKAYRYPPLQLFDKQDEDPDKNDEVELKANAERLVETLESFGVKTRLLDISRGPSVTRYELQPHAGVKISKITNLSDDIALNLAVGGVRIEAPIPGKAAVGIEVPNRKSTSVSIRGLFESQNFAHMASPLAFVLGKDIAGVPQVADLCKMPHLLIAGSTGSGKSVCVNSIIISFLYRTSPEDLKLILIDPKVVELAEYNGIPHLLMPVITEPRKAAGALGSAVAEMEKRYRLFAENNVRDIKTYNKLAQETGAIEKMPYVAIVIDELADLMMVSGKEVEDYICRIAQKARAAGMHLIVATQRPSVDVITGLIKANIPSRISFAVSSQIDSRTILDSAGAEKLLGMGDMLFMPTGTQKAIRIQGTYVKDSEISRTLAYVKESSQTEYNEEMIAEMEKVAANQKGAAGASGAGKGGAGADKNEMDSMLKQCAEIVIEAGQASTSLLQRRCKLGYARAARIMDEMEQMHIIGPYEGAKPRAVLVNRQQWIEMCLNNTENQDAPEQTSFMPDAP